MSWLKTLEEKITAVVNDALKMTIRTYCDGIDSTWKGGAYVTNQKQGARLVAVTEVSLDGDVDIFVPRKEDGSLDQEMLAVHRDAVKLGTEARAAMLKAAAELLRSAT